MPRTLSTLANIVHGNQAQILRGWGEALTATRMPGFPAPNQLAATRSTAPFAMFVPVEKTVTSIAPSGPWAMPPGNGNCPPPMWSTVAVCENGSRTTSPGAAAGLDLNTSVPQKLPDESKVHLVIVVRPLAHRWKVGKRGR